MGFRITFVPPGTVRIRAPLAANRNDKGTAFAGSIYSALVLAPWCLLTALLKEQGTKADVMVYRSEVQFRKPIHEGFVAKCVAPNVRRKLVTLPSRISLTSEIRTKDGVVAAKFCGVFYICLRRAK
jgi:thioesterase domain-containing protein